MADKLPFEGLPIALAKISFHSFQDRVDCYAIVEAVLNKKDDRIAELEADLQAKNFQLQGYSVELQTWKRLAGAEHEYRQKMETISAAQKSTISAQAGTIETQKATIKELKGILAALGEEH